MLTKNFYKIMLSLMTKPGQTIYPAKYDGTSSQGITAPAYLLEGLRHVKSDAFSAGSYGTWFGTGTTPPTPEDTALESPIKDGTLCSTVSVSPVQGFESDHARLYAVHEVCNTGDTDITVTEVGVFGCASDTSDVTFLLDRTVPETPVTIPAGGSKSIMVAIVFQYPNA